MSLPPSQAAADLMHQAAQALRDRTHAVPGFSPAAAELLDMTADAGTSVTRQRRDVAVRLAREVLGTGEAEA
jgi:hypothetical protein